MLLLENGASMHLMNNDFVSPLEMAANRGQRDLIALYLEKGGFVNHRVHSGAWDGETLLQIAVRYGHTELVELLLSKGATMDQIQKVARADKTDSNEKQNSEDLLSEE